MDSFTAIQIAEGLLDVDNEDLEAEAWQVLVDTGLAWHYICASWFTTQPSHLRSEM
jgi:hypothetical protein